MFPYKLKEWVDINKLNWRELSLNPFAVNLLRDNRDKIDWINLSRNLNIGHIINKDDIKLSNSQTSYVKWYLLSGNPNAINFLRNNPSLNYVPLLSGNPNAIELIEKNLNWLSPKGYLLSENPNGIELLKKYPNYIDWEKISKNPNAINIIEKNLDKISWKYLSANPSAINILKNNIDKINWYYLSLNPNPEAIQLLSNYPEKIKWKSLSKNYKALDLLNNNIDKIKWKYLSENPNAENLIKNNLDKIDWNKLSSNPVIFEIDYDFIKKNLAVFNEDLMKKCYHPDRLKYYLNKFNYDIGDDSYVDNLCLDDS